MGRRKARPGSEKGPPREPSEAGRVGRGGARERVELLPQAEAERSGLCGDEAAPRNCAIEWMEA